MADIKYVITLDSSGATKAMQSWDAALKEAKDTVDKSVPAHDSLWKQFAIGGLAAAAVTKAVGFLTTELKGTITAAIEAEDANRKLESALATTGQATERALPELQAYADELMKQTVYDDEAVKGAMALGIQLGLTGDEIKEASKAAIGLTSTFGGDLQGNMRAVALGMQGNYLQLSRMIPAIRMATTDADKHNAMMKVFGEMYQRAQGETSTFGGSLKQLNNQWNEVKERAGSAVVQNEAFRESIKKLTDALSKLAISPEFQAAITAVSVSLTTIVQLAEKAPKVFRMLSGSAMAPMLAEAREEARLAAEAMKEYVTVVESALPPHRELPKALDNVGRSFAETGKKKDSFKDNVKKLITVIGTAVKEHRAFNDVVGQAPAIFNDAAYAIQGVLPPARDMVGIIEQAPGAFDDMAWGAKRATEESRNYVSLLLDDMRRGFASTIKEWVSGATTFGEFMKGLWGNIKDAFFGMIGEMIAEWTMNFLKKIATKTADALTEVASGAKNLVSSVSNILSGGLAAGIGSFVGTFLGSLLGGGGGLGKKEGGWIHEIRDRAYDIMHTLDNAFANLEDIRAAYWPTMFGKLDGLYAMVDGWLRSVELNTRPLKDIKFAQHGVDMTVTRPTLFMAGEAGPERVRVTPNVNVQSKVEIAPTTVNLDVGGQTLAKILIRYLPEYTKAGLVKIHTNALVTY